MNVKKQHIQVEGRDLTVSNLDKVLFLGNGFTKGQVIKFYSEIAWAIVPHLKDRPLTLKRYPDGITGEHFYEKNAPVHTPEWVKRFAVERSEGKGLIHYVLCNNLATLVWTTNLADIEKHVLLAHVPCLHKPTAIVFDLDPGEPAGILECGEIALALQTLFDALGLESFVKVSGSKGLHLTVPINSECTYEMTQPFAKTVAELMREQMPDRVVSDMKKALRTGKVLIDWSQNSDFKTTVAVYAMRAKRDVPFISLPITWEELKRAVKKKDEKALFFTPAQAIKRINKFGDLFESVLTMKQKLPEQFTRAIAAGPKPKLTSWQRHQGKERDKSLKEYAAKRDHSITPEPPASTSSEQKDNKGIHRFVIQKHAASHLHYDFRLEMQGVLRSWAVPKGPPLIPRETRLAMHVEDHPVEYAGFEGIIPQGQYGGGTVMVWDEGEYGDITGNPAGAFYQGKMHIVMQGKKLKGEWILLKDKREDEDSNKWMLIKAGKPLKLSKKADDTSAISGRSMAQIAKAKDREWQSDHGNSVNSKERKKPLLKHASPHYIEPMQCRVVEKLPDDDDWTFEIKFDGFRCMAIKHNKRVQLFSRNEKVFDQFPGVVKALALLPGEFVVDGEIVALDAKGHPSFQLLQNSRSKRISVCFYAFDLVHLNGEDLTQEPIERRRELLEDLIREAEEPVRPSPKLQASGDQILKAVRKLGLEGVVGKKKASKYEPGERRGLWIKHRTDRQQEFVIGGYEPGSAGFDSLLVGVYDGKKLNFVAKVKNGFVSRLKKEILPRLKKLNVAECPFNNLPEEGKGSRWRDPMTAEKMKECRWVKPSLVCQVSFVEWTDSDHLRHCSFSGMREDKSAKDVVRET